jgi:hypothetical protein
LRASLWVDVDDSGAEISPSSAHAAMWTTMVVFPLPSFWARTAKVFITNQLAK